MAEDKVHKPSLPGVKTYAQDAGANTNTKNDDLGITFLEPETEKRTDGMHTPESAVTTGNQATHKDGISGNNALDVSHAFESSLEEGTIITDKKKRFGKPSDIAKNVLKEWVGGIKSTVKKLEVFQKEETPMMLPVEKRKAIISEAGKLTKQVPHDDYQAIIQKLKTTQKNIPEPSATPILVKEKKSVIPETPKWTHTVTEPNTDTPTTPSKKPLPEHVYDFRQNSHADTHSAIAKEPTPPIIHKPLPPLKMAAHLDVNTQAVKESPQPQKQKTDSTLEKQPSKKVVSTAGVFRGPTRTNVSAVTKRHIEEAHEKPPQKKMDEDERFMLKRDRAPESTDENREEKETFLFPEKTKEQEVFHSDPLERKRPAKVSSEETKVSSLLPHLSKTQLIILVTIIVVGGIAGGIGALVLTSTSTPNIEVAEDEPIPSFFSADSAIAVSFSSEHNVLMNTLNGALLGAQGQTVQIYPVTSPVERAAVSLPTSKDLFEVIAPHANSAFIRSIGDTVMLGAITTSTREPFIILQSNNFDTAFAGMLGWESFLAEDLSPFFDTRSLTEAISEGEEAPQPRIFTDATRQNRSIRILYDHEGNERIIYAFVSRRTLIITETTDALSEIISRLQ